MPRYKKEKKIKEIVLSSIILILTYFVFSTLINYIGMKVYYTNTDYDVKEDGSFEPYINLANNAPISLPFNNALFYAKAYISKGNVSCNIWNHMCNKNFNVDITKIESGESKQIKITIFPNNQKEFILNIKSYMNILNIPIFPKSKRINCILIESEGGWNKYSCKEI